MTSLRCCCCCAFYVATFSLFKKPLLSPRPKRPLLPSRCNVYTDIHYSTSVDDLPSPFLLKTRPQQLLKNWSGLIYSNLFDILKWHGCCLFICTGNNLTPKSVTSFNVCSNYFIQWRENRAWRKRQEKGGGNLSFAGWHMEAMAVSHKRHTCTNVPHAMHHLTAGSKKLTMPRGIKYA